MFFLLDFSVLAILFFLIVTLGNTTLQALLLFIGSHIWTSLLAIAAIIIIKDYIYLHFNKSKKNKLVYSLFHVFRGIPVGLYFIGLTYTFTSSQENLFHSLNKGMGNVIFTLIIITLSILWDYVSISNDSSSVDIFVTIGHLLTTGIFIFYISQDAILKAFSYIF